MWRLCRAHPSRALGRADTTAPVPRSHSRPLHCKSSEREQRRRLGGRTSSDSAWELILCQKSCSAGRLLGLRGRGLSAVHLLSHVVRTQERNKHVRQVQRDEGEQGNVDLAQCPALVLQQRGLAPADWWRHARIATLREYGLICAA